MPTILTFAEHRDGKLRRASLETVSEARRLSGGEVETVLIGSGEAALVAELGAQGAKRVHVFADAALATYGTEPYTRALAQVIASVKPWAVFIPFTAMGKDLAPRVAAKVGAGLASDCVGFAVKDGHLEARRPVYAGKAYATVRWDGDPQIATLRPNVFALDAPDASRKAETVASTVETSARARITATHATGGGKVELTEAQVVVSGGRGLKGPEHFHLVQELADAFRGAMGASRAVVDAGWVDHQHQVGQTGKTVSPNLYVAVGLSGAIQHLAGMSSSRTIVAINKDPDAPIFKVASYGILGDVFEIVPKLTEAAKTYFTQRG
jgi:electron transfer flavoprotein alpha subunit